MRKARVLVVALVACLTLSGCDLLGGDNETQAERVDRGELDVIGCCGATELIPLYYAVDHGLFKDEGLKVNVSTPVLSGPEAIQGIISGEHDIAFSSYTPFVNFELAFRAGPKGQRGEKAISIIADGTAAAPGNSGLMVREKSPITSVKDLRGKRIAVTAPGTMAYFMAAEVLRIHGITPGQVTWAHWGFDRMAELLDRGEIDAALMTEPFKTAGAEKFGLQLLEDPAPAIGAMASIPIGGYGAMTSFVKAHRDQVDAFQRALKRSSQILTADREKVEQTLIRHSAPGSDMERRAKMITPNEFRWSLDVEGLTRVVDLQRRFPNKRGAGAPPPPKEFKISSMIVRPAA